MGLVHVMCICLSHDNPGPSPPRGIELRVGYNAEVCASWRPPATPVGEVTLYKLYAEIVDTSSDAIDAIDIPSGTVVKV